MPLPHGRRTISDPSTVNQRPDKVARHGSLGHLAAIAVGHGDIEHGKVLAQLHGFGLGAKVFPRA